MHDAEFQPQARRAFVDPIGEHRGFQRFLVVLVALAALICGIVGIVRTTTVQTLDAVAPRAVELIHDQLGPVDLALELVSTTVEYAQGGSEMAGEWTSPAQQAYADTWLTSDDVVVLAAEEVRTRCLDEVELAGSLVGSGESKQTMVVMAGRQDLQAEPPVATLDRAWKVPSRLATCLDDLGQVRLELVAGLESAKASAAWAVVEPTHQLALADLVAALESARQVLDLSLDKVTDDSTRMALLIQIKSAEEQVGEAEVHERYGTEPDLGKSLWTVLDDDLAVIQAETEALKSAAATVMESHDQWLSVQDTDTDYTGENGRLDPDSLCSVPYDTKQLLACNAVAAWMRLNEAYKPVFGEDIPIDLSYRTYDEQVEMRRIYGSGAAVPGTSNHGWGTAVDLPDYREGGIGLEWNYGTEKYEWLKAHAPAYGWVNPSWAVQGGVGPHEPWHFEYVG